MLDRTRTRLMHVIVLSLIVTLVAALLAAVGGPQQARAATTVGASARPTVVVKVAAWNEKSFPAMPRRAYRRDFQLGFQRARADVYLSAEISLPDEIALYRRFAAAAGLRTAGVRTDTAQAYDPSVFHRSSERDAYFHKAPGGPFSPARRYVMTKGTIAGADGTVFPVAFVALHLTNDCLPKWRGRWWYAARCRAVAEEVSWVRRHLVRRLHRAHITVVVGGDMNVSRIIRWHRDQRAIRVRTLMQVAVVPARGVRAHIERRRWIGRLGHPLATDHLTPVVRLRLTADPTYS